MPTFASEQRSNAPLQNLMRRPYHPVLSAMGETIGGEINTSDRSDCTCSKLVGGVEHWGKDALNLASGEGSRKVGDATISLSLRGGKSSGTDVMR